MGLIWLTKDGRKIAIEDLETSHLQNIILMIRRKGGVTIDEYIDCCAYVCSKDTPDGAQMCAESELSRMKPVRWLDRLEAELQKRR